MRCEVVAIGTELLLGQIVDTNSSWIGEQLALIGVDSLYQTKVGDNHGRIVETLHLALSRSDAVICCGGLGPTQDDITRAAIADVMGVELVQDPDLVDLIRHMFSSRGRKMPENNLLQADVPAGASIIEQRRGTAPGLICPVGDQVIYAVPGVPHEMHEMMERAILPDLKYRSGDTSVILSRVLRTWGESESGIAERLAGRLDHLDGSGNTTIAFLASGMEGLKVRITAKGSDEASAAALVAAEEDEVRAVLGDLVFGADGVTMEHAVLDLLATRNLTLGLAESVTGGYIAQRITDVPGSSQVFRGSIVSYASDVKFKVLGLPEGPVVSDEAAMAMAEGARRVLDADVGLAVTGVAGPDSQEGQRPGTVYIGWAIGDEVESTMIRLPGDRTRVRQFAVISALDLLRRRIIAGAG